MTLIEAIRAKVRAGDYEFSEHALDQSLLRGIEVGEIVEAIARGDVIEDYPADKYGPSCLIAGRTAAGRTIHVQCSYPARPLVKIITTYEPDPSRWINDRERRPK